MKAISQKSSIIIGIVVLALIISVSIASAQNGKGNNSPPSGEQKNMQNQNQQQNQNQNQVCMNGCDGTQQQNQQQNQNQASDGVATQQQNQYQNQNQNQNQDCINDCDGTQQQNQYQNQVSDCPNCPVSAEDLPDEVIAAMTDGVLDEYTAYEIYSAIIAQFGEIKPFTNIQKAEAAHIRVWEYIFDKYGLELPESPIVDVPRFDSITDACSYALELEIDNGTLYEGMLETVADYSNLSHVVEALQSASLNHHLPALENCVAQ